MTLGIGSKIFSSGFEVSLFKKDNVFQELPSLFTKLLARILIFPMPTMCVFNGHAVAGGLILGLVHDFRIMREEKAFVCLSELNIGITLPPGYAAVVRR